MDNLNYVEVPLNEAEDINKDHSTWKNNKYVKLDEGQWVTYYAKHKIEDVIIYEDNSQKTIKVCLAVPVRIKKGSGIEQLKSICSNDLYNEIVQLFEADNIEIVKNYVLDLLSKYNVSERVDGFLINGEHGWLSKAERTGLTNLIDSQRKLGITDTTLWLNGKSYNLKCDELETMLAELEVYAWKCFNTTALHEYNIKHLKSGFLKYDYTKNYPEQINFEAKVLNS